MPAGTTRRPALVAVLLLCAGVVGSALPAAGAPAARRLYAYQSGCGGDAEAGRLLPDVRAYTRGCSGDLPVPGAGLPAREVGHRAGEPNPETYLSDARLGPFRLDRLRPVTGRVAAESWYWPFAEVGVGEVTWDVRLRGVTTRGALVDLGSTTVSAVIPPGATSVAASYRLSLLPAAGQVLRAVRLDLVQRGVNVGMSARRLGAHTWVALPTRAR